MVDRRQSSTSRTHVPGLANQKETEQDGDALNLRDPARESQGALDPMYQDPANAVLGLGGRQEGLPPEEMAADEGFEVEEEEEEEEEEALSQKGRDVGDDVPEISRLSISHGWPVRRGRRRKKKISELARPKTNWQVLKDRVGCRQGFAWISHSMTTLHFSLFWPSVYWTERFLEDTTLSITVPVVSRRVEELARPKRFYAEYYNNNRTTPVWPLPRCTLEHKASGRLKELATPRVRNNIWSLNMAEVSQVSRAAQMAIPSPRILYLAKPRPPATLLKEWDPVLKPKPHVSDYNRLLHLAMPKAQSDKCVPDRDPRWEVLDATKKAVASPRIISLAQPKVRRDLNEGYDPYHISPGALVAQASPRLYELATPKSITRKI